MNWNRSRIGLDNGQLPVGAASLPKPMIKFSNSAYRHTGLDLQGIPVMVSDSDLFHFNLLIYTEVCGFTRAQFFSENQVMDMYTEI